MDNWEFKKYDLDMKHVDIVGYIPRPTKAELEKMPRSSEKMQSDWALLTQEQKDFYNRQRAGYRTKSKIRRSIIKHNLRYMWTLTFRTKQFKDGRGQMKDAGNLSDIWKVWRAFLQRCRDKDVHFRYIVTVELHEKRLAKYGERVYHFHFATDTFIHHSQKTAKKYGAKDLSKNMLDLWGYGFVYATNFMGSSKAAMANYLTKYVTKAFEEIEQKGVQRYRISEGLNVESELITDIHSEIEMDAYVFELAKRKNCFFKKSYDCLEGGDIEILIYTIFPKTKKNKLRKEVQKHVNPQSSIHDHTPGSRQISLQL